MEVIFAILMSLLPFQMLGAGAYQLSRRREAWGAKVIGFFTPAVTFGLVLGARQGNTPTPDASWWSAICCR